MPSARRLIQALERIVYQWIATSRITILGYLWTALGAIALVAFPIGQLIWPVPIVEELKPLHLTIAGPVRIYSASRVGRWAIVPTSAGDARIENICSLWSCNLSSEVHALRAGDRVTILMQDAEIWQMTKDGQVLLEYAAVVSAHNRQLVRYYVMFTVFTALGGILTFWGFHRARRSQASLAPSDAL